MNCANLFTETSNCFLTQNRYRPPARSEHSPGGAQRSEQYLDGAQRAIKSLEGLLCSWSFFVADLRHPGLSAKRLDWSRLDAASKKRHHRWKSARAVSGRAERRMPGGSLESSRLAARRPNTRVLHCCWRGLTSAQSPRGDGYRGLLLLFCREVFDQFCDRLLPARELFLGLA